MEKKTFEDNYTRLLDYQERKGEFFVGDIGCGMVRYRSRPWGNKGLIVADKENRLAYMLVMPDGERIEGTLTDITSDAETVGSYRFHNDFTLKNAILEDMPTAWPRLLGCCIPMAATMPTRTASAVPTMKR